MVDLDWDAWRANYDEMTFADQQEFYRQVAELYPHQESANVGVANEAFDLISVAEKKIIELGGWNGRLASQMLPRGDVAGWLNTDLVEVPQACGDERYAFMLLDDYLWNKTPADFADVFVACHTIEHLSKDHVWNLINWIARSEIPWVYFEAPIEHEPDPPRDWTGYAGSHIFPLGWEDLDWAMGLRGYERVQLSTTSAGLWRRG